MWAVLITGGYDAANNIVNPISIAAFSPFIGEAVFYFNFHSRIYISTV